VGLPPVPAKDPQALAGAIARVLDDEALRFGIAARALAEVRAVWSWPVIADRVTAVYDRAFQRVRDVPVPAIADPPVDPSCRFRAAPHLL
jgi:glycogen(starch) synthase